MSRDAARRYLIAYDIPQDRRRSRLADKLESYGDRIQYSVFVADISPGRLQRLRTEISLIIESDEDSVLMCDLGPLTSVGDGRFEFMGCSRPITSNRSIIV